MDFQPMSGRLFPRFSAIKTFFRLPYVEVNSDFDVGIFGIPFDGSVSYRPGTRFGPTRIREMSSMGRGFHWERSQSVFDQLKVADIGDCPTVPIDQAQTFERIQNFVGDLLKLNKRFIAVGGDHSITLPILRELRKKYGRPLQLIHFDAHLDTYPAAWNCEYHHGTFARHALEEGLVDGQHVLQIGVRGPLAGRDDLAVGDKFKVKRITVDDIRAVQWPAYSQLFPKLSDAPTYISFDIDCLDPAFAPGTGTPVPGGLSTYEAHKILQALNITNLVGADIVEVSPPFDHAEITSLAAVSVMFEFLSQFAASKR